MIISPTNSRDRPLPAISEAPPLIVSSQSLLSPFKINHYSNCNSNHYLVFVYSYIV